MQDLRLDRVSVRFGALTALDDVTFGVGSGEKLALVGPSGAGKTTLLRLFNGMVRPTEGAVRTLGHDLSRLGVGPLRRLRARVGFVHQELHLVPGLSVLRNVLMGALGKISTPRALLLLARPSRRRLEEVYEVLQSVGVGEKLYERVDRLSGGQRQRVAIARALFQQPDILLADEPVSSVDPGRARAVLELLARSADERGLTLCVSLHHLSLVREFFPRLVGLRAGRIVFDRDSGSIEEGRLQSLFKI